MTMAIIGINTFLWTTDWRDADRARCILGRIKDMGFDAVQIPVLDLAAFDRVAVRRILEDLDLACYISAGLKPHMDVTGDDPEARRRGVEFLKGCLKIVQEMGAPFLSGSFHSVFGRKLDRMVAATHWERSARCLKEVAREARALGLCLVLEPINRYESFLVNTLAQARRLIDMIGEANVKVQLDTFHMNIEEDGLGDAIVSAGDDMLHFHVAENHRGAFGGGTMPWDEVFGALGKIDYRGAIVIESFVPEVAGVAAAACIWRRMAPSADALARGGLEFLRNLADEHGL